MKRFAAMLAALLSTACAHDTRLVTAPASAKSIADAGKHEWVRAALASGGSVRLDRPRDFGIAWCGDRACARKGDIVSLEFQETTVNVGQSLLIGAVGVPAVVGLAGLVMLACTFSCSPGESSASGAEPGQPKPPAPPAPRKASESELARAWLDGWIIDKGVLTGRLEKRNPCIIAQDETVRTFETDAQAMEAVWTNRTRESALCLDSAAAELLRTRGAAERLRSARLWALSRIKGLWYGMRCENDAQVVSFPLMQRIVPPPEFDIASGRGDPAVIAIIEETLADPESYADSTGLEFWCRRGVRPETAWPAVLAYIRGSGPYAPDQH